MLCDTFCSAQLAGDQAVKQALAREPPAKMGMAMGAKGYAPAVSGKPGELGRGGAVANGPRGGGKAANFKGDAGGIEKEVLVAAVDSHGMAPMGDRRIAHATEDGLVGQILRPIIETGFRIRGRRRRDRALPAGAAAAWFSRLPAPGSGNGPQSLAPCR